MARRHLLLLTLAGLLAASAAPATRIVAVGDVHGEIDGLDTVLQAAGLTDENGGWVGGNAILVQTGDMTDRGSRVRAVMDRLRALQAAAPTHGGRVVVTLGNHEISNLSHLFDEYSTPAEVFRQIWADFAGPDAERRQRAAYRKWRSWHQRYPGCVKQENRAWAASRGAWMEDHPPGYVEYLEALSPAGEYGAWLRGLELATEVDETIFMHGGISPWLVDQGYDSIAAINEAGRQAIERFDRDRQRLIDEGLVLPFSDLWEMACALYVEMARLEIDGGEKALARRAELARIDADRPGAAGWFPTEEHGPLWYRGLAMAEEAELEPQLTSILATFDARRIAVGHTPQPKGIRSRFGGRVYLIDTAMAYQELGGRAAALEIDGDRVTAIYAEERVPLSGGEEASAAPAVEGTNGHHGPPVEGTNGQGEPPVEGTNGQNESVAAVAEPQQPTSEQPAAEPAATQLWLGPDGEPLPFDSIPEILDFLTNAKVLGATKIATGITLPRKILLEHDGVRAHAIFHNVEILKPRERLRGGQLVMFFRDHYANNVAAFELARMLGMHNVPPAVVRKVGRETGSVQLWIENSMTEADRRSQKLFTAGPWRWTYLDMQVFDNLANNIDRNQGNLLFDGDRNLWFIDHTRTFSRMRELPSPKRVTRCSRRLWRALQELNQPDLVARLRPYMGLWEIRAILVRRDLLVEHLQARIDERGEDLVLFDYDDPLAANEAEDPELPEAPPDSTALPADP